MRTLMPMPMPGSAQRRRVSAASPSAASAVRTPLQGRAGQRGQALLEFSLLAIPLILIGLSAAWLGDWQRRDGIAGMEVRRMAFQRAAGMPVALLASERLAGQQDAVVSLPASARAGGASAAAVALRQDFLPTQDMLAVQGWSAAAPVPTLLAFSVGASKVSSRLVVLGGSGSAAGDRQVQQTIANSVTAWQQAADVSQARARLLDQVMQTVDEPWRPGHDESAWLLQWAGDLPAEYLAADVGAEHGS